MAYKNLVNVSCTTLFEFLPHVRDFLCKRNGTYDYSTSGIGWTLEDSSYATDEDNMVSGDWFVISSVGESGNERLFVKIEGYSTGYIRIKGYLDWNSTAHTGTQEYTGTYGGQIASGVSGYIYGDLDSFSAFMDKTGAGDCTGTWFGMYESPLDEGAIIVSGSATAGSDVAITVADSTLTMFDVGRYLFIYDADNIERALIKTNNGSTQVTVDLVSSYAAGYTVRAIAPYAVNAYQGAFWSTSASRVKEVMDLAGTKNSSGAKGAVYTPTVAYTNPGVQSHYMSIPLMLVGTTANMGSAFIVPNIFRFALYTSLSLLDVLTDIDGVTYRYFEMDSVYCLFKEV